MCRVDDCDPWDFGAESSPVARKEHRCSECGRMIQPHEVYRRFVGKYDSHLVTYKTCSQCVQATEWLRKVCGGAVFTEVRDELVEHWHEGYASVPFGRLIALMRRRWWNGRVAPDAVAELVASALAAAPIHQA